MPNSLLLFVVQTVFGELRFLLKKRRSSELDSKLHYMRFIGELVKFHVCPPDIAFRYLDVRTRSRPTRM